MKHLSALDALLLHTIVPGLRRFAAHLEAAHAELLDIARTHAETR